MFGVVEDAENEASRTNKGFRALHSSPGSTVYSVCAVVGGYVCVHI